MTICSHSVKISIYINKIINWDTKYDTVCDLVKGKTQRVRTLLLILMFHLSATAISIKFKTNNILAHNNNSPFIFKKQFSPFHSRHKNKSIAVSGCRTNHLRRWQGHEDTHLLYKVPKRTSNSQSHQKFTFMPTCILYAFGLCLIYTFQCTFDTIWFIWCWGTLKPTNSKQ